MSAVAASGPADAPGPVDAGEYLARLKAFEGRTVGAPTEGPDAVNQAMIRHWVEAMGDENPVYTDEQAARANGFPGVIAPPTMLQSWIMRGYKATAELADARAAGRTTPGGGPADELMAVLDEGGFTSVVATNCEQEYRRPLVLGDRLSVTSSIESVSPEKHTGLGVGHFVTTLLSFTDQSGEPVADMRFRILKFRPGTGKAAS
ncbi:MAG TPA: MaoC family dehydratase N-terminal domain-containing protein [Acidimicrobiales bacterium]|nr:MaoC family dehydratase N-terminal domain-containing protein [Acidimicrobiales bacterium]